MAGQKRVFALDVPAIHVFDDGSKQVMDAPGQARGMTGA